MRRAYVVGITGGSGSGKTSFVRALQKRLGEGVTTFSQDDYYRSAQEVPLDAEGVHNFDLPESINSAQMAADIQAVLSGETIQREEYTFETAYRDDRSEQKAPTPPASLIDYTPAPVIIIEGLFVLHEAALTELMDLKLFVDASDVAKLTRRIRRDRQERGLPLEDVLFRYEAHVLPAYESYIEQHRAAADLIVNNHHNFDAALDLLASYLKQLALADH